MVDLDWYEIERIILANLGPPIAPWLSIFITTTSVSEISLALQFIIPKVECDANPVDHIVIVTNSTLI